MEQGGVNNRRKHLLTDLPLTFIVIFGAHMKSDFVLLNVGSISFTRSSENDSAFLWMLALPVLHLFEFFFFFVVS